MQYRALVLSGKKKISVEHMETKPLESGWVRIKLGAGGICGSDLHYYRDYGNVGFPLKNPVVMGHEASGAIFEIGPDVEDLAPGDKVAVNPVINCGFCPACHSGQSNLCQKKRFPGSALNYPHINGLFREYFEMPAHCCRKVPADTDLAKLAFVEPLACSLHAVMKAGNITGRRVLITGSGPIGVLAAAAARCGGAGQVAITDVTDEPLNIAKKMGADLAVNSLTTPLSELGRFDVAVDASGSPSAVVDCMRSLRKGGTMVQLGTTPSTDLPVPWILLQSMEINILGCSQFNIEFDLAVALILGGRIDPMPMLSRQFAFEDGEEAFKFAGDRKISMKTQFISAKETK